MMGNSGFKFDIGFPLQDPASHPHREMSDAHLKKDPRTQQAVGNILCAHYPQQASGLLKILEPFFAWEPRLSTPHKTSRDHVLHAMFWRGHAEIRIRFVCASVWAGQDQHTYLDQCNRLEEMVEYFYLCIETNVQKSLNTRIRSEQMHRPDIWSLIAEPLNTFFLHPSYRWFEYGLVQAMRRTYPRALALVAEQMVLSQIKLACMFKSHGLNQLSDGLRDGLDLWLQGTPLIGLDQDHCVIVLISDTAS